MIRRELESVLKRDAALYPVITLFGPRQSGKTTLVRSLFPSHRYANLEDPQTRQLAETDYKAFFERFPPPVVIDEIQRVPMLASAIQVLVDGERDRKGAFVLTGSHQPLLSQTVSQSLAGRTAVLTLYPPTLSELGETGRTLSGDELLVRGFMPELHAEPGIPPGDWYRNYFRTYVERDVRTIVNVKNLALFERFILLLAGRVGQIVNFQGLAGETGISAKTASEWLSILEASFLVFRLQPWFSNISKRLVRSPKVYFADVGLAAWLLGIETPAQAARDPLRGALFENLVVADAWKRRAHAGKEPRLAFLRTGKGFEIDLLLTAGRRLFPVEIKSAKTWHDSFAAPLRRFMAQTPGAEAPCVVYDGESLEFSDGLRARNFHDFEIGSPTTSV